jgi:hypothetical protein
MLDLDELVVMWKALRIILGLVKRLLRGDFKRPWISF